MNLILVEISQSTMAAVGVTFLKDRSCTFLKSEILIGDFYVLLLFFYFPPRE